jgi:hypothetical protein
MPDESLLSLPISENYYDSSIHDRQLHFDSMLVAKIVRHMDLILDSSLDGPSLWAKLAKPAEGFRTDYMEALNTSAA